VLVDGGTAKDFDGSVDDYIAFVLAKDPASAKGGGSAGGGSATKGLNKKDQRRAAAEAREKSQDLRKKAKAAEGDLEKLVSARAAVDLAMFDPSTALPALTKLTMTELMKRRAELDARIAEAEAVWMEANEALEAFAT
jgi:ATP-binding cassette subfamily F protein 3